VGGWRGGITKHQNLLIWGKNRRGGLKTNATRSLGIERKKSKKKKKLPPPKEVRGGMGGQTTGGKRTKKEHEVIEYLEKGESGGFSVHGFLKGERKKTSYDQGTQLGTQCRSFVFNGHHAEKGCPQGRGYAPGSTKSGHREEINHLGPSPGRGRGLCVSQKLGKLDTTETPTTSFKRREGIAALKKKKGKNWSKFSEKTIELERKKKKNEKKRNRK